MRAFAAEAQVVIRTPDNRSLQAYCGIDVACAKGKRLPVAVLVRDGSGVRALPLRRSDPIPPQGMGNRIALDPTWRRGFAEATLQYLRAVEERHHVRIAEIAIDAPRAPARGGRRSAELAMDAHGISCIATPSVESLDNAVLKARAHSAAGGSDSTLPHANQIWMLVGFDLFATLSRWRPCIEVFPQATVRTIAPSSPHKSKPGGLDTQLEAFAKHAGWNLAELTDSAFGARHDRLDALMSAWIASLPGSRRVAYGDGALDTIWSVRPSALNVV